MAVCFLLLPLERSLALLPKCPGKPGRGLISSEQRVQIGLRQQACTQIPEICTTPTSSGPHPRVDEGLAEEETLCSQRKHGASDREQQESLDAASEGQGPFPLLSGHLDWHQPPPTVCKGGAPSGQGGWPSHSWIIQGFWLLPRLLGDEAFCTLSKLQMA